MTKSKKTIYCSQCKNSRYVPSEDGKNALRCMIAKKAGAPKYMPTDATRATDCSNFEPERVENVPIKTDQEWKNCLRQCGISQENPYNYESAHPPR